MAMNPLADLTMAAAQLKGIAPTVFQLLCEALKAYEASLIAEALAGDNPNDLFRGQGRVKATQAIRKHITQCAELRETYTRRDTNARSGTTQS
jgi:hypothetical protein